MADNLHRQFDHIEDFETEHPQTTNYQDYQSLNSNSIKLQDMIFFGRVSSFCVSTVLVAFLFLVAQVATFWAFFWAITISVIGQIGIYVLIEYYKAQKRLNAWSTFFFVLKKESLMCFLYYFTSATSSEISLISMTISSTIAFVSASTSACSGVT